MINRDSRFGYVDAVLFDMDGVLVDVSQSYRQAIKLTAEHFLNMPVSKSDISDFKNRGGFNNDWELTEALIRSHGKTIDKKIIIHKFQEFYLNTNFNGLITKETWLLDKNVISKLLTSYKFGIITGRPREEAEFVLTRFEMKNNFEIVVAMEDTPKGKPDPAGIIMALNHLNVKEAIYLGDTVDDMKAAKAAKIIPVGVLNGNETNDQQLKSLVQNGARVVLKNINDIMEMMN